MKSLYVLFIAFLGINLSVSAQCDPYYDWGELEYGVDPDPALGETFEDGFINTAYSDEIFILVPTNASVIVEDVDLPIDSVRLDSITITQDGLQYSPEEFGVELLCNNDGTSIDPCTFIGGQTGCGVISGTPLLADSFEVVINATIFVNFFGVQEYPFEYSGYTLYIDDGVSVEELEPISELRVTPNPFSTNALVEFHSAQRGEADFKVYTLLGEEKYTSKIQLETGHNKLKINSSDLESGVYLYHVQIGDYRITKRLVVKK